jgi:uncharacterized membrane protein YdjX (TVP38/TMEM64 family)
MDRPRRRSAFALIAFPLLICAIVALFLVFRREILGFLKDRDALRAWILGLGAWGPAAFIGLQVLQVVVFVVPGEVVQIVGGYVFGFWLGSLYTVLGITVGTLFNFFVGRLLGRPFVESLFDREKVEEIERVTGSGKGAVGFFLLFLIPGIPKDVLCYVAGMSALKLPAFLGVSMAGRLPGILGSAFMGGAAYAGRWGAAIVVLAVAGILFALGILFKGRIQALLARVLHKPHEDGPEDGHEDPPGRNGP